MARPPPREPDLLTAPRQYVHGVPRRRLHPCHALRQRRVAVGQHRHRVRAPAGGHPPRAVHHPQAGRVARQPAVLHAPPRVRVGQRRHAPGLLRHDPLHQLPHVRPRGPVRHRARLPVRREDLPQQRHPVRGRRAGQSPARVGHRAGEAEPGVRRVQSARPPDALPQRRRRVVVAAYDHRLRVRPLGGGQTASGVPRGQQQRGQDVDLHHARGHELPVVRGVRLPVRQVQHRRRHPRPVRHHTLPPPASERPFHGR